MKHSTEISITNIGNYDKPQVRADGFSVFC